MIAAMKHAALIAMATCLWASASAAQPTDDPDRLGVAAMPEELERYTRQGFTKYTEIVAPNGRPIRIIAQEGVRDIAVARARNLLVFFLTDVPGSQWGESKEDVANAMADNRAMLMMPEGAHREGREPRIRAQPLYEDETPVEGSRWYLDNDWGHRDAGFEEIFHLVHDFGIGTDRPAARPRYQEALDREARAAMRDGRWGIPIDPHVTDWLEELEDEGSLAQEYIASVIDSYYGLWATFDENPGGMWGIYIAKTRDEIAEHDPQGLALIEAFLPEMMIGYEALIDPAFEGEFDLRFNPDLPYTHKSRYYVEVRLTGTHDAGIIGNDADNRLTGNRGDNRLVGGDGADTAVFQGPRAEYTIERTAAGHLRITDQHDGRDGADTLIGIESVVFSDQTWNVD